MSVSKIYISKFSGDVAKSLLATLVSSNVDKPDTVDSFCSIFLNRLNSGLSNDYLMIWDNYSVGGDQIDYAYKLFKGLAKSAGEIRNSSWKIAFGFSFDLQSSGFSAREPRSKIHRLILLNSVKAMLPGDEDLIVCVEQMIGPTISDIELISAQKDFISVLPQNL